MLQILVLHLASAVGIEIHQVVVRTTLEVVSVVACKSPQMFDLADESLLLCDVLTFGLLAVSLVNQLTILLLHLGE